MGNLFDHYVFDLDQTLADTGRLKPQQDEAARDWRLRPAFYEKIAGVKECAGAAALLAKLKARGGKVVVLTNAWRDYASRMVAHLGFEVDEIVAGAGKPRRGSLAGIAARYAGEHGGKRVVHAGDSVAKDLRESVAAEVGFVLCLWGERAGEPYAPAADEKGVWLGQAADVPELRKFLTRKDAQ